MTSSWIIALVGVLYALTVGALVYEGQLWKALIFTGYTIGQIGFFFDSRLPPS
jgi:hypothetical protein